MSKRKIERNAGTFEPPCGEGFVDLPLGIARESGVIQTRYPCGPGFGDSDCQGGWD